MLLRKHHGGYAESMATVVEIDATMEALKAYIMNDLRKQLQELGMAYNNDTLDIRLVIIPALRDARNGWDTHLVRVKNSPFGDYVYGYTDAMPVEVSPVEPANGISE